MKKRQYELDADDLAIYEPVNSRFREQMFMKWRMEGKKDEECGLQCKGRSRKNALRNGGRPCNPD